MDDRWRTARCFAWIATAVFAAGCGAPVESAEAQDLPLEVQVWSNLRVIPESIAANGFRVEGLPPGRRARLTPWHIQGINPRILFAQLELVPGEPSPDVDADAAAWVECSFDYDEVWVVTPEGFIQVLGAGKGTP